MAIARLRNPTDRRPVSAPLGDGAEIAAAGIGSAAGAGQKISRRKAFERLKSLCPRPGLDRRADLGAQTRGLICGDPMQQYRFLAVLGFSLGCCGGTP